MANMTKFDAAVANTEDNLRKDREIQEAREDRIHAADVRRADESLRRAQKDAAPKRNLETGLGVAALVAIGALAVVGGGSDNEQAAEHGPSLQDIQRNVEAQTVENDIHKQIAEGKVPVIKVPASVVSGEHQ